MRKCLTTEEFVNRAMCILGDDYDFTKTKYLKNNIKVIITCKFHGDFLVIPNNVLEHFSGCPLCRNFKISESKKDTKQKFIKKAKKVHGDKYNYSLVNYINSKTPIKIVCPIHGIFEQTPNNHLKGSGCPHCPRKQHKQDLSQQD